MPTAETETIKARNTQSQAAKRATLDLLRAKKRQEKDVPFLLNEEEVSFHFRSISAKDYDKLLTEHPPNLEQRAAGSAYNIHTFAPALLAAVITDPELTPDQWGEIWTSPDWNRGELMSLFGEAIELCNTGLSLGPTATG